MNKLVIPSIVAGSGAGGKKLDQRIIIKDTVIPEASEKHLGKMYCYAGETNSTYTHGYIYECVGTTEAQSITTDFYPGKMAFDYEAATHPYKTFTSDAEAMTDFFKTVLKIDNPYDIVSGKLVVDEATIVDPNQHLEMWNVFCTDKNGQQVLSNYKISAGDLEAYGFQFAYPAADYHENEPINYTLNWITSVNDIHWERINVQPSSAEEVALLSITTAPFGSFSMGSKYYNSTEKKIYTATLPNSWTNAIIEDPSFNAIYIYNSTAYVWDGNSLELFELEEYQRKLVSGQNIKTINGNSILGSGNLNIDTLPSQTSNAGKSLITDGTDASWQNVEEIEEQNANELIKVWYGTQNEYDAISEYDDNTDYKIVDDSSVNSTLLATQQEFNSGAQNKAATPYQVLNAASGKLPYLYYYNSGNWTISPDNLTLTIADTTGAYLVKVYKNGLLMEPTADYTVSGASLIMITALGSTDKIAVEIIK